MNLNAGAQIVQPKRGQISIQFQNQVAKELKRLIKHGYVERATYIAEDCFVCPAVIPVKKDKSVKIDLNSRKLSEVTVKRKAQSQNKSRISEYQVNI